MKRVYIHFGLSKIFLATRCPHLQNKRFDKVWARNPETDSITSQSWQETNPRFEKAKKNSVALETITQKIWMCRKASAWQSWKELGGWKCVAAGAKWILNTSLHGVTLSKPFLNVSLPFSLSPSLSCFYCFQRDTQEANDLRFPWQPIDYQMKLIVTNRGEKDRERDRKIRRQSGEQGGYFGISVSETPSCLKASLSA